MDWDVYDSQGNMLKQWIIFASRALGGIFQGIPGVPEDMGQSLLLGHPSDLSCVNHGRRFCCEKSQEKNLPKLMGLHFPCWRPNIRSPLYTAMHPTDGFDQFKSRKIASFRLSFLLMFVL